MVVDFSKINLKERPMLVLKTQSDEVIQTLGYAFNVEADLLYNEVSTLTFDLPAYVNGVKTPNYDEVKGTRIVDFVGVGLFILVDPTTENDGVSEIKHCKAYSLEYEFTKKQFYIAGNEDDVDEDGNVGYKMVYQLYDGYDGVSNTETIIGRIHEKMPEWTFEVDTDLYDKFRTFDSDVSDNVYNFIKSTVQETYGCIFDFDTYNRHVKVISTESTVAQRQVYLSQENLIKTINIDEDSDSVVTSLDVSGEEGVSIRFVNPTGQNNIYDLHYFLDELPASLRTKWNEWTAACEAQRQNYFNLAMSYQVKIADILTEEVKLVDLEGELRSAETVQGAEVSKPDPKQSDLDAAKAEVARATNAVNAQKSVVNSKIAQKNSILNSIQSINYSLAWESVKDKDGKVIGGPWKDSKGQPFTAAELKILRRYFFEDSVEDSSFALATTNSYTNKDVGSGLKNITINITNDSRKIERANSSSPVYSFAGGKITVGTNPNYVAAKIVRGTAEVDPSTNKVILTAYLERGDYSQTDFEDEGTDRTIFDCGTITLTGTYTKMSYNGSTTQEGIYAGTSLILTGANVQVYFSKNTSEFEQYSVEWDLFNYGKEILQERSEPSYTFTVEAGNFLVIDDYFTFQNDLKLGQRVYLNLDGTMKTPYVTSVHVNYEDLSDFKIEFCNTYRASDSSFRLSQLLEQSIRLGKSLNIKGGMYSQFQATGAQNAVKEFMNSALDIAKNNVLSSENQAITFDESGLRLRKWKDKEAGTYEDEQIWMNDNTIAFTDDNWSTAKMAIGKIIDTSVFGYVKTEDKKRDVEKSYYVKQADGTYSEWTGGTAWNTNLYEKGYAYGIAAPYLVGTVLAGSNLIITANNHSFKIDGNGIRIKTDSLLITNSDGEDVTFTQTIKNAQNEALSETGERLKELMQVLDPGDTDMNLYRMEQNDVFDTVTAGAENGDLLYFVGTSKKTVTINGKSTTLNPDSLYRIVVSGGKITALNEETDEATVAAIKSASNFQNFTDNKCTVYVQNDPPVKDKAGIDLDANDDGDIWFCDRPTTGDDSSAKSPRVDDGTGATQGTYRGGKMYRYSDPKWVAVEDPFISDFNAVFDSISGLKEELDDKVVTFYQNTEPTEAENGDLWYYNGTKNIKVGSTTITKGKVYRLKASKTTRVWEELTDPKIQQAIENAATAQNTADGKAQTWWTETPPEPQEGDDGDLWYCTLSAGSSGYSDLVAEAKDDKNNNYYGGRLYYCKIIGYNEKYSDGTVEDIPILKWKLLEDKGMSQKIEDAKKEVQSEIAKFYKSVTPGSTEKYLVADIIKGTIDASVTSMSSAKATGGTNFYIDEYGYWFADKIIEGDYPRREATTAIWINDKGILYGHKVGTGTVLEPVVNFKTFSGDNYDYESGRNGSTYWVWTTSINHQGITTQALAAQTLTGVTVTGASTLQIGEISAGKFAFKVDKDGQIFAGTTNGSDYNFKVDRDGNVIANNGTFTGTVNANDLRIKNGSNFTDKSIVEDGKILGDYLDLRGINIKDANDNTVMTINDSGVTLKSGAISWNSNVPKSRVTGLSAIEETANNAASDADTAISTANSASSDASTALSHASTAEQIAKNIANGSYSGTFIDGTKIYSPEIYSTTFSVLPDSGTQPTSGGFEIWGYFSSYYRRMLQIKYTDAGLFPQVEFNSDFSSHAMWNFSETKFFNTVDFSHATVTGLSSTATFG